MHRVAPSKHFTRNQHYVADLAMSRKTYDVAREQGIRVMSEIRLPPGRYQLRLAAGNPSGKAGSVAYDLTVPDFGKDPLTLSGLVLTSDATQAASTIAPKDPLVRLLPRPATARRSFDTSDTLVVFGEVYDNVAGTGRSATNVRAELRDETGAVVRTDGSAGNRFALELPLERLSSGAYVVHVEATATLGKPRSASRDIPVRVIAR